MHEYNTKYGKITIPFTLEELGVDLSNIKPRTTLEDFEGDEDMYRIYLEIESIFGDYEKRVENSLITERKSKS